MTGQSAPSQPGLVRAVETTRVGSEVAPNGRATKEPAWAPLLTTTEGAEVVEAVVEAALSASTPEPVLTPMALPRRGRAVADGAATGTTPMAPAPAGVGAVRLDVVRLDVERATSPDEASRSEDDVCDVDVPADIPADIPPDTAPDPPVGVSLATSLVTTLIVAPEPVLIVDWVPLAVVRIPVPEAPDRVAVCGALCVAERVADREVGCEAGCALVWGDSPLASVMSWARCGAAVHPASTASPHRQSGSTRIFSFKVRGCVNNAFIRFWSGWRLSGQTGFGAQPRRVQRAGC